MKYVIGIVITLFIVVGVWFVISSNETAPDNTTASTEAHSEGGLTIVTSSYPLQYAAEQIIGNRGTVINLGKGTDPHDYEPTTRDMLVLQDADLVVLQGADFEPWGDDVVAQLSTNDVAVHIAVEKLELMEGGHEDHEGHEGHEEHQAHEGHEDHEEHGAHAGHGGLDPHTWLDPLLYRETVGHLAEAIVAIDEANATLYQDNAAALQAQLATLHDTYQSTLSDCSLDAVITSHDAFGYLAKRYEFEVHSIAGLSTQDTPSATTLAELREEAEEGIGAILLEENSVAAYGETLARETGLQTLSVSPIAYIESDDENYLSLMQENLNVFATALQCNA